MSIFDLRNKPKHWCEGLGLVEFLVVAHTGCDDDGNIRGGVWEGSRSRNPPNPLTLPQALNTNTNLNSCNTIVTYQK